MDNTAMLPCRFCGNRPWLEPLPGGRWLVECDTYGCESLFGAGNTKQEAIQNWNKMQFEEELENG